MNNYYNINDSFIEMKSTVVTELANKTLEEIKEYQENKLNDLIEIIKNRHIVIYNKKKNSIFYRLFKISLPNIPNDEEIIKYLNSRGSGRIKPFAFIDEYEYSDKRQVGLILSYNSKQKYIAQLLLHASKYAEVVYVSTHDLQYIT